MPAFHTWISFVAATEALLIIPGPTVLLVISYALAQGKRSAWATVPGVAAGDFTAMALSLLGLGAVLAASAELFTVLKLAGAAYLVYLGIKILRTPVPETLDENAPQEHSPWKITAHAYAVTALNPKGIVFYVAFFPLFLSADLPLLAAGSAVRRHLPGDGDDQCHPLRHDGRTRDAVPQDLSRAQEPQPRRWRHSAGDRRAARHRPPHGVSAIMPELHVWIAFVIAAEALLIMPGPTDMVVVSYALSQGRRSAWASVPGVTLGDATALILSLLGLGAVLMASSELFNVLKIAGAIYLVYLGIKTWRAPVPETIDDNAPLEHGRWRIMAHTYVATALNPGGIVFYVAFFPQFLSAEKPLLPQVATFGVTFILMGSLNSILYATLALQVRRFVRSYRARKNMNRATGGFLIAMGGLVGLAKRAA